MAEREAAELDEEDEELEVSAEDEASVLAAGPLPGKDGSAVRWL
jgi:hypothetical protein